MWTLEEARISAEAADDLATNAADPRTASAARELAAFWRVYIRLLRAEGRSLPTNVVRFPRSARDHRTTDDPLRQDR